MLQIIISAIACLFIFYRLRKMSLNLYLLTTTAIMIVALQFDRPPIFVAITCYFILFDVIAVLIGLVQYANDTPKFNVKCLVHLARQPYYHLMPSFLQNDTQKNERAKLNEWLNEHCFNVNKPQNTDNN